jgi:hypothetical protein
MSKKEEATEIIVELKENIRLIDEVLQDKKFVKKFSKKKGQK